MQPDGTLLLCRMPPVILPEELKQQLNQTAPGLRVINDTEGPGIARYTSESI